MSLLALATPARAMSRRMNTRIEDRTGFEGHSASPELRRFFRTVLKFTGYMEIPSRLVKYKCGRIRPVAPAASAGVDRRLLEAGETHA